MAGFRLTTKVQVSGWRFLLRRVEHAIVRRDTRMFDDPLQFYSRAVSAGIIIAVLVCLGAALLAYFKPLGKRGGDTLLVDRTTNQLYVMLPGTGQLRPVYNLTSARLVLGNAGNPFAVKSDELNRMPKGQPIGIPGAPYATPVSGVAESMWTLCDTVTKPESVAPGRGDVGRWCGRWSPTPRSARCARTRVCWCRIRTRTGSSPRPAGTPSISPIGPSPRRWGFRSPPRRLRSRRACSTRCRTRGRGSCRTCPRAGAPNTVGLPPIW